MNSLSHCLQLSKKEQLDLYNFSKEIKQVMPKVYFTELFDYIAARPERKELLQFMDTTFSNMLNMAREQLTRVWGQLDALVAQARDPDLSFADAGQAQRSLEQREERVRIVVSEHPFLLFQSLQCESSGTTGGLLG